MLALLAALILLEVWAFSSRTGPQQATGVVVAVDGPSAAEVTGLTMRTDGGQTLVFRVGTLDVSGGGLPAPHLREHLVSGEPITIFYSGTEIFQYVDAPR